MNKYISDKFLNYIEDRGEFVFQTFPEIGGDRAKTFAGSFQDCYDQLRDANRSGQAVAVTINATDGRPRKSENVTRIRAVWNENDEGYSGSFPLEPSLMVETSPGRFHYYWLIEDKWSADDSGRMDFRRVMATMVKSYGSDGNASDISRALRLPGSLHQKSNPFLVRIVWDNEGNPRRYTRQEIVSAFAGHDENEAVTSTSSLPPPLQRTIDFDQVKDALQSIPSEGRNVWLKVGMALHHESNGSRKAFEIWDDWARNTKARNYDEKEQHRTWEGFRENHGNPVAIGTLLQLAKENGWKGHYHSGPLPEERFMIERHPGDLTERTMLAVREFFAEGGKSNPSEQHYEGMEEIAKVIQAMAEGRKSLGNDYFLSSLPPGIGKTTTIGRAIYQLVRTPAYEDVGVVFFLSRVEEIKKLIDGMGLKDAEFATLVSQNYRDKVPQGNLAVGKARVLFTTQQMLEARLNGGKLFTDVKDFHFKGKARQVRIWDEGILPSNGLVVGNWDVSSLLKGFGKAKHYALTERLEQLSTKVKEADGTTIFQMPDILSFKVGLNEARGLFTGDDDRKTVEALWKLSGKRVLHRRHNTGGFLVGYEEAFPEDLGPILVCDASGPFREVYRYWNENRKGLRFLHSPGKRYSGLTIHHWDRGSGKDQFRKSNSDRNKVYDGILKEIQHIADDEIALIVHFKQNGTLADIEDELRDRLLGENRVRFCTWGKHTATNDFVDCRHVFLVGLLQYDVPHYEALGRGAKKLGVDDGFSQEDSLKTRLGEIKHHIFQAACRGAVRKAEGDCCPPDCHLYVIYSTKSIPAGILEDVFPEAKVVEWKPVRKLNNRKRKLADYILSRAKSGEIRIPKSELSETLGIRKEQLTRFLDKDLIEYLNSENGLNIILKHHYIISKLTSIH